MRIFIKKIIPTALAVGIILMQRLCAAVCAKPCLSLR